MDGETKAYILKAWNILKAGAALQFDSREPDENDSAQGQQSLFEHVGDQHMHQAIAEHSAAPSLKTVGMVGMGTAEARLRRRASVCATHVTARHVQPAAGLGFTRAPPQDQVWRCNDLPCCIRRLNRSTTVSLSPRIAVSNSGCTVFILP